MTKMYHGTVEEYLPQIATEGLRPDYTHRWEAKAAISGMDIGRTDHILRRPHVYLASTKRVAEGFAMVSGTLPGHRRR